MVNLIHSTLGIKMSSHCPRLANLHFEMLNPGCTWEIRNCRCWITRERHKLLEILSRSGNVSGEHRLVTFHDHSSIQNMTYPCSSNNFACFHEMCMFLCYTRLSYTAVGEFWLFDLNSHPLSNLNF